MSLDGMAPPETSVVELPAFELFWDIYPKKVCKIKAEKLWSKLNLKARNQILDHLKIRVERDTKWKIRNGQFIQNPTTFLNQGCWYDEYPTEPIEDLINYREYTDRQLIQACEEADLWTAGCTRGALIKKLQKKAEK